MGGLQVVATDNVAEAAAGVLADQIRRFAANDRRVSIAVSGGETPWATLDLLASIDLPWQRVEIYQVDERIVPADHPAQNLARLKRVLTSRIPVRLHPMPVETDDLEAAAADYAASLPVQLDIVQLGLGVDGHAASLLPGDSTATVSDRDVAITSPYQGHRRMTLTLNPINRAGSIVWIVSGAAKREAVAQLMAQDRTIPAGQVSVDQAVLIADSQALSAGSTN